MKSARRREVGAEILAGGVNFRVAAPGHQRVSVVLENGGEHPLHDEGNGLFSATVPKARAGDRYRFRIDGDKETFPDPASRFQPDGPHGPSQIVDPSQYEWRDRAWRGVELRDAIIYELHIGTYTREGTYRAAVQHLEELRDMGINVIEVLPVHDFPGRFGWGYDGVDLWAPAHQYGTPDDLRFFVDSAHAHGIAVILDVVYNHFGPDGCYLTKFTEHYFTDKYVNDWGAAVNFEGEDAAALRPLYIGNAAYWIDEFHFDGLRLDATQSIFDESEPHIIREICDAARNAAPDRRILVVGENEPQDTKLLREYGLDALWNDDWHHCARVALNGKREAYYTDYLGTPQEFVSMAMRGFLYQGQRYSWQKGRRGTSTEGLEQERFITYLQNHDQVANSAYGERIQELTTPGRVRAMTALLILAPQIPMLFQGQEFGAESPFLYFADHKPELAKLVREGRREFLKQFPSIDGLDEELPRPEDVSTFEKSKLDHDRKNPHFVALHRDLIKLRRELAPRETEGAVIGPDAFALRLSNHLLIVNLGAAVHLDTVPESLLAHSDRRAWELRWSSESAEYGGAGSISPEAEDGRWVVPAQSALVLR